MLNWDVFYRFLWLFLFLTSFSIPANSNFEKNTHTNSLSLSLFLSPFLPPLFPSLYRPDGARTQISPLTPNAIFLAAAAVLRLVPKLQGRFSHCWARARTRQEPDLYQVHLHQGCGIFLLSSRNLLIILAKYQFHFVLSLACRQKNKLLLYCTPVWKKTMHAMLPNNFFLFFNSLIKKKLVTQSIVTCWFFDRLDCTIMLWMHNA